MISTSNSNWLDRLRSSRGFPTGDEPDLDHFLSSSSSGSAPTPNDSTTHSESTQSLPPIPTQRAPPPPREFSGVLCDLFNMGGGEEGESSRTFSFKSSRKQPNPRFFRVSLLDTELPSSSNELRRENIHNNNNHTNNGCGIRNTTTTTTTTIQYDPTKVGFGDDDENVDLKAYTRSEVTIIDTSFDDWKCDKWVFRKNNDWKIKDKKGCKSKSNGAKKKKVLVDKLRDDNNNNPVWSHRVGNKNNELDDGDDNKVKKKKKKRKREVDNLLMNQQNKEPSQNDKAKEPFKEREDFLSKVPRKRFPCPRPPEKVGKERSPVVIFKCIPPGNVNTALKPGKTFHKKRPKQMKIS